MILFIADIHIKLGQKNVPFVWQWKRFLKLADEINKLNPGLVVIGGDLLDVADPSIDEVGLMYEFLTLIKADKILIPGNHEMVDKRRDCYEHIQTMLAATGTMLINSFMSVNGIDYIPYNDLKVKWPETRNKIAFTHVRGEIPPHVEPEIPLERFEIYEKVFAGDLHSYTLCQRNIYYPGSPLSTSFHRNRVKGGFGAFLINPQTYEHEWVEFDLPQLIRKTVSSKEEMVPTSPDHTIYELEGSLEDLSGIENSELLDKKVVKGISKPPTLDMSGNIADELAEYLVKVLGIDNPAEYTSLLEDISNDTD